MADTTRMYGMDAKDSTVFVLSFLLAGTGGLVPVSQNGRRILWFRMYLTSSKMRLAGIR